MTTPSIEQTILQRPQSRAATIDDDGTIKSPSGQSVSTSGQPGGTGLTAEQEAKLSGLPDAAALAASLVGKVGTDKLGVPSGVAELDSTGKLKASQLPASALVDVSATGAALSAGVLSFTQDEGGPTITVDLNSFATDAEVTAGLAGKASTAQGAKADTSLQPGPLPVDTTITAAQVSDAGAAGREVLKKATLPEIQALVSGDGIIFSDPLVKDTSGPTITLTGATGPVGLTSTANTSAVFDYVTVGPTAALAANAAFMRGAYTDRHFEVTFGTNSADFYITQIRTQTNANIWWRDLGARKWVYAGNISLDATGQLEFYRVQWPAVKAREYKVVGINLTWASIKTQTTDVVFRCTDYGEQFAHATCDSYGVGVGGLAGMSAGAPYQALQYLGYRPFIDAQSGSGWLSTSTIAPTVRITRSLAVAVRKNGSGAETPITFAKSLYFLGYNDAAGDQGLIAAAIDATYAAHPTPKPDFIGPWEPLGPTTNITNTAATIAARATALAAKFVPLSLICNTGNAVGITSSDNVHPRQEGHNYWAINGAKRAFALGLKAS